MGGALQCVAVGGHGLAQYGDANHQNAEDIAVDAAGNAYVASRGSGGFPTSPGAWRTLNPGDQNGRVAKILWDTHAALSINDRSRLEGHSGTTTVDFYLSLNRASAAPVSVNYATANGTAIAGSDYDAASANVTIPAGSTGQYINFSMRGDYLNEANETFVVNLSGLSGANMADAQGVATISNDDQPNGALRFSASTGSVSEADGTVTLTVERINGGWGDVGVSWSTANGSATADANYTAASGTLSWPHNDIGARSIEIPISNDALDEINETFTLALASPSGGATLAAPASVTVTVVDDDAPPVLSVDNGGCSVTEGNSGSANCNFLLRLAAVSTKTVTFSTTTANGTATAGSDYTGHAATARSIAAGQTTLTVAVPVLGDTTDEDDETFSLQVSGVTEAGPASLSATAP